jgi:glutathione S-transferase
VYCSNDFTLVGVAPVSSYAAQQERVSSVNRFPYLIDPNTGTAMYESSDIVKYLFRVYGEGAEPTRGLLGR